MKKMIVLLLTAALCLSLCACGGNDTQVSETKAFELDMSLTYYVDIVVKDYGTITVQLDQSAAPVTVANFLSLVDSGFYDGLTFHRIIEGFMIQGGDPKGNGTGSSTPIVGEFSANGHDNPISHERGVISMARRGDSFDSGSCQFFIVHVDSTYLDGQYAAFGHVTEGMEVVDAIAKGRNGVLPAEQQPVMEKVTIRSE